MKIRNGFVSNSSSSSFVLVVSKREHDYVMKQLKSEDKNEFLKRIFKYADVRTFLGQDVIVLTGGSYDDYTVYGQLSSDDLEYDRDEFDYAGDAWDATVGVIWNKYFNCLPKDSVIMKWLDH